MSSREKRPNDLLIGFLADSGHGEAWPEIRMTKLANVFQHNCNPHRLAGCPLSELFLWQFSQILLFIDFVPTSWIKGSTNIKGGKENILLELPQKGRGRASSVGN